MNEYTAIRTCPLCEATCGLEVTVKDGKAVKVRGDKEDVFSKGYLCPKGASLHELHHDPDRLRTPLIKKDGAFVEVSWQEAFEAVEAGLLPLMEKHGRDAIGAYLGNPCVHTMAGITAIRPMLKALGSKNIFSASTVDQIPKQVSSGLMFGSPATVAIPDIERTHFLLILGANPLESNGSLATAPDWPGRLRAIKDRGGRLIVVDPIKTRTGELAHEHLAIKPGGDAYLLMAMIQVLFEENLTDLGGLDGILNGMDKVQELCRPFTPELVSERTGLDPARIRDLARELAAAESAVVYGRMGTCTVPFGALTNWLVDVVNALTGNLDKPGGAMFATPAHAPKKTKAGGKGWGLGRWKSRVKGLHEVMGELPVCTLCDEMETPGEGQVRALITVASNPVIALPNVTRIEKCLENLDFMVSVDWYVTASTRHADVILPPTGPLSTGHYDFGFYGLSVHNIANYSPPVLPKPDNELDKWEILYKLAMVLSGQGANGDAAAMDDFIVAMMVEGACKREGTPLFGKKDNVLQSLSKHKGPERMLDFMLRTGPHGDGFGLNPQGLSLDKLLEHPHGIDLGHLEPRLPGILKTLSGKVELAPEPLVKDVERLNQALNASQEGLVLVGRRHIRTNNSWLPNIPSLVSGPPRCVLLVNPGDASRLGLVQGGMAEIASRVGKITAPVEISEALRQGVVSLPHGWGHDLPGVRMKVARAHGGINSNILTDDLAFDPVSNNSVLNGIPVEVRALN